MQIAIVVVVCTVTIISMQAEVIVKGPMASTHVLRYFDKHSPDS